MTTTVVFLIFMGYTAYRRTIYDLQLRARRSALIAMVGTLNIPLVYGSVHWWESRTLHQKPTISNGRAEDFTLFTMMFGVAVFMLVFAWMFIHRFRIGWLEYQAQSQAILSALDDRRDQALDGAAVHSAVSSPTRLS